MTAKTLFFSLLLTSTLACPALAQQPVAVCQDEPHDDFDFWVGTWNVYAPEDGPYQGENRIERINGGCLITEHWNGAGGSIGESMNFYDPFQEAWRQVWISAGAIIDYTGGLNAEGEMVLNGEIHYPANGNQAPFRGTWTPREDGTVRQHFEQQNPQGEWGVWFTGIYVRQDDDPRAAEAEAARGG
ncbi:MAG: hypothetical protein GYB36_00065 [Alphaproteobacteria bacterium]|nr:hypothetical protein [Alphaproteobacteria bacterium]